METALLYVAGSVLLGLPVSVWVGSACSAHDSWRALPDSQNFYRCLGHSSSLLWGW
ncbi:MAG: hypothetical protein CM1200mP18_21150 [Gammaproteobacteria bacterium]|nr:MAG: hypothetical protein CM1200mP18_21150 [Gammaproteobacteria bacterium]